VEANGAEFLLALGRAGGGLERRDAQISWTIGGSPIDYHNAVVAADLAPAQADLLIDESRALMLARGVPGTWHVGPSMAPPDLGRRLLARGFRYGGYDRCMGLELASMPEQIEAPSGLSIQAVGTPSELATWTQTLARGFGEGEREANWVGAMYARLGYTGAAPWRHFLGTLDGAPVATATLFLDQPSSTAGIYFVLTIEAARRRGIGAAITLAALRAGRAMGASLGVLGASELGQPVYRRLGFQDICRIELYELSGGDTQ
jgi:ribosomal protein S18 acetylase RimI-like enzyme